MNNTVITHQPIVRHGRRQGQLRPVTDLMLDRVTAMKRVMVELRANGYTVIGGDINGARPSIIVEAGHLTDQAIVLGFASYNYDNRATGHRKGQWLYGDCHIVWEEGRH